MAIILAKILKFWPEANIVNVLHSAVSAYDAYIWALMKNTLILISALLFSSHDLQAQIPGVDTLFNANEIRYYSDLERSSFQDFLEGKPDYLAMIAAVNPNTDKRELGLYREWVNEIIASIRTRKFEQMAEENKIDRIQKYVRKGLLVNYKQNADFEDLFLFGDYNYFTAAAIYSFILDDLGIPYEIYDMPTHIQLVAYPKDLRIGFETTRPGFQFFMFDHEVRTNFVEFIYHQGVIDEITYKNTSTRDLFQKFFFAGYGISIREMIGMLYINSSVKMLVDEHMEDAFYQLEKAFVLFPCYKSQYMLLAQLNAFLLNMDYHDPLELGYLIKASRLINYGIKRKLLDDILIDLVNKVLIGEEDPEGFGYVYDYLQKYLEDKELKTNFTYYYLYESGRIEFNNTRYSRALDFLERAYAVRPDDERTQDLLARSLGGYSLMVSPGLVLERIKRYDTSFTNVTGQGVYKMTKMQTYLVMFGEAFQMQDGETGEQYLAEFEKLMDENPGAESDHILIGRSYSSAAIYYYRNGKISRSKQVVKKGLSYAPDNIELKLKLESFD